MTDNRYKSYIKTPPNLMCPYQCLRPYEKDEDLSNVSVRKRDMPGPGGMIALGDDGDLWYVSKEYFDKHYKEGG